MHHRGQLMLIERMIGIVPHFTREMQARFAAAAVKRIKSWGFNAIGEYAANYVWPDRNSEKAPMLYTLGASNYGLRYGGVKDLIHGTDPARYTGWRGGSFPAATPAIC